MRHAEKIKELLRPVGIYRLSDAYQSAEWEAVGAALDSRFQTVAYWERESILSYAEDVGLTRWAALFPHPPAAQDTAGLRTALTALAGIGEDSFTLPAVNASLKGCGLPAVVRETDTRDVVEVSFSGIPGIPADFAAMKAIIEDILPCHLEVKYRFWYLTWVQFEARFPLFQRLDDSGLDWTAIETLVEGE